MKVISLKELKENLSEYAEEAANGTAIEVTKYNRPFIYIMGIHSPALHVGSRVGKGKLRSAGKSLSRGSFLATLDDDRGE